MYKFPEGRYSDVRIEKVRETFISYLKGDLRDLRERDTAGAFIRVFDGARWYYASITELSGVQAELDRLAKLAAPNKDIAAHQAVKNMPGAGENQAKFNGEDLRAVPLAKKHAFLASFFPAINAQPAISMWSGFYKDTSTHKELYNSKGVRFTSYQQLCGIRLNLTAFRGRQYGQGRALRRR